MGVVTIGVDVGQKHDPTAIVVCEVGHRPTGRTLPSPSGSVNWASGEMRAPATVAETETWFEARHLERLPLGTPYPAVGARIVEVARGVVRAVQERGDRDRPSLTVVVDATGVGAPVVDILRGALRGVVSHLTAATFTHGDRLDGRLGAAEIRVGKAYLVSRLQALFQTDRLALPPGHAEATAMLRELLDYEIRVDQDANDKYGAFRVGTHDDLVTALGLAVIADPWVNSVRSF